MPLPQSDATVIIQDGVRYLQTADYQPQVFFSTNKSGKKQCYLSVVRNGDCGILPISKRVAEELIATGFAYGN